MIFKIKYFLLTFYLLHSTFHIYSQEGTRKTSGSTSEMTGKVMLVPFEPKLYMSEMDMKINQQTQWDFEHIRENFRHQLDIQLKSKLKDIGSVVSYYTDSASTWKDLMYVYKSTGLSYDLVDKPTQALVRNPKESSIKNGQLETVINNDKKFMNTKIQDVELMPYLTQKYLSDYFVFINELDIKSVLDSYNMDADSYQREVSVHYSILDKTGKTICGGLAAKQFSSKENNPKKIVAECFAPIATEIFTKLNTLVNPPKKEEKKK